MFDKMGQRLDPVIDNVNLNEDQQCFIKQVDLLNPSSKATLDV